MRAGQAAVPYGIAACCCLAIAALVGQPSHGFVGIEAAVVDVIARWAAGQDIPPVVGP